MVWLQLYYEESVRVGGVGVWELQNKIKNKIKPP